MTKTVFYIIFAAIIATFVVTVMNCAGDAGQTVNKEFNASALLKKYEYFKDLSAAIDKKRADIEMYKEEIKLSKSEPSMDSSYITQRKVELMGIISIHNQLCADYNAQMSKFNYRFTNAGDLPATNLEPLPREIKPYITSLN